MVMLKTCNIVETRIVMVTFFLLQIHSLEYEQLLSQCAWKTRAWNSVD